MKKKILLTTILLASLSFTLVGCNKKEVQEEVVQGEVAVDETNLTKVLIEYANEDLISTSNFTVSFYNGELNEENLHSICGYDIGTGYVYSYDPQTNLDVYKNPTVTFWYDRDEKLWYRDNSVNSEDFQNTLPEFIEKLDILKYNIEIVDEEIFNSTNCYVLKASAEGLESYTNYYITKDTYTLLGTKQQLTEEDLPFYTLINYDANFDIPESAINAEVISYSEYLKNKSNEFYEIYESLFGEMPD